MISTNYFFLDFNHLLYNVYKGLPFAVQQCGFLLGMFLLAFVAFLIDRGAIMIVDCGMKVNKYDFEELAEYLLGKPLYLYVCMYLCMYVNEMHDLYLCSCINANVCECMNHLIFHYVNIHVFIYV